MTDNILKSLLLEMKELLVEVADHVETKNCSIHETCVEHKNTSVKIETIEKRMDRSEKITMWGFGLFVTILIVVSGIGMSSVKSTIHAQNTKIDYTNKRIDLLNKAQTETSVVEGVLKQEIHGLHEKIGQQNAGIIYFKDSMREVCDRIDNRLREIERGSKQ